MESLKAEQANTDEFINKVLPTNNFTQMMLILRSVLTDEEQLAELERLNDEWFEESEEEGETSQAGATSPMDSLPGPQRSISVSSQTQNSSSELSVFERDEPQ